MNNLLDVLLSKIQNLELADADRALLKKIATDSRLAYNYNIIHPNDQNGDPELMVLPAQNNWVKYLAPSRLLIINNHIIINCHKVMDIILCKGAVQREIQLNVELSGVCNLQCHYCSLEPKLGNRGPNCFMTLQTLQSVFEKIIDRPLYKVNGGICFWNGGEPLLHPKFEEIAAYLSDKQQVNDYKYNFVLLTNATCLTDQKIRLIIDCGAFKEIIFSVDGGNVETFEKMRYPAKWSNVAAKIQNPRQYDIRPENRQFRIG
jgi:sulfatase maturation enzyme AslB (radical SAM superfamily)